MSQINKQDSGYVLSLSILHRNGRGVVLLADDEIQPVEVSIRYRQAKAEASVPRAGGD